MNAEGNVTIQIDRKVWKAAKLVSVEREVTLKEYVETVLEEALRKENGKK